MAVMLLFYVQLVMHQVARGERLRATQPGQGPVATAVFKSDQPPAPALRVNSASER